MTKQSRKELLKQDDAFTTAAEHSAQWVEKHRAHIVLGLAFLVLLASGAWGISAYNQSRNRAASLLFGEGWEILDNGRVEGEARDKDTEPEVLPPDDDQGGGQAEKSRGVRRGDATNSNVKHSAAAEAASGKSKKKRREKEEPAGPKFASEKEKWSAARGKFTAIVDKVGNKGVGAMAAFVAGDLSDKLGETDKAEKIFADLAKQLSDNDHLYFLAAERLAYLHEKRGDRDAAIEVLRPLASDDRKFYSDYAQYHQARLYLAKNDKKQAKELLEHLERSFPNSSLADDVRLELEELGGADPLALPTDVAPLGTP